jgi:hypothetical protein
VLAIGRGAHRRSTDKLDGIVQVHQCCTPLGHDICFRLVGLLRRWCGQFLLIHHRHEAENSRSKFSWRPRRVRRQSRLLAGPWFRQEDRGGVVVNATPPSAATTSLGSDPLQSEDLRNRSRLSLYNSSTEHQEANNSESLSALEKDLDYLLRIGKPEATARWGAAGCLGDNSMMITSTPEGRFVHWKGMKLSNLLEDEDRLVAHLEPLPF